MKAFNTEILNQGFDNVAAITIGGLVAGKVLAKVGFFAIMLKFWKLLALAAAGLFGAFWKKITGKKDHEYVYENTETIPENAQVILESTKIIPANNNANSLIAEANSENESNGNYEL
ncbi:MAG: DUF2167 domain-containing protein [bacterium]|nr:DUF2167 domain-containing protein [bacterium]